MSNLFTRLKMIAPGAIFLGLLSQAELQAEILGSFFDVSGESPRLLYHYRKTGESDGESVREITFTDLEGRLATRRKIHYVSGELTREELEHFQLGESGVMRVDGQWVHFSYTRNGRTRTSRERRPDSLVPLDEMDVFLSGRWEDLVARKKVSVRIPVLSRLSTWRVTFRYDSEDTIEGRPVIVLEMKVAGLLAALFTEPKYFFLEKAGRHRVLQILDPATPKVKTPQGFRTLRTLLRFDP